MTLKELRDDVLRKVWVEYPATAPTFVFEDVTIAINSALQLMWTAPVDYFRRSKLSFTLNSGVSSYTVQQDLQEIIGPVTVTSSGAEIIRARDPQEFAFAAQRFLGASTTGSAVPVVYFVDSTRQVADDSVTTDILFSPAPAANTGISIVISTEAPNYTVAEVTAASTAVIPVPHQYVETVLLPLARNEVAKSHWFWDEKNRASFKEAATMAMAALGVFDPDSGTRSTSTPKIR
jgi:hypothetical protein